MDFLNIIIRFKTVHVNIEHNKSEEIRISFFKYVLICSLRNIRIQKLAIYLNALLSSLHLNK